MATRSRNLSNNASADDKKNLQSIFKKIGKSLQKASTDFATLEVTTITGDVTHMIDSKSGKFKFQEVLKELDNTTGSTTAKVSLIAHTHIDFDHDTVNFVKSNLGSNQMKLFHLHQASIDSAHEARRAFVDMLREIID